MTSGTVKLERPTVRAARMRAALARPRIVEASLVLGGALLLALAITWPLVLHFGTDTLGGGAGGDRSGYVWDVWFNGEHGLRLWGTTTQDVIGAPFGREQPASINTLQIVFLGPAWLVTQVAGPIAAVNASVLLGMTLAPAAMYLLIRWLGLGIGAAAWAAVAFAVFPNALVRATGHYPLALLACFPILLLVLWRWMEAPGRRRAVWLAVGTLACWLTNPYYGAMSFVILAVGGLVAGVRLWRTGGVRAAAVRLGEALAAVVAIVTVPLALLFWSSSGAVEDTLTRSRAELALYGAHVRDYLVPDSGNEVFRTIFGDARWTGFGTPGGERSEFLGYVTLGLAAVGLVWAVRMRGRLSPRLAVVVWSAVPLMLVLAWFSLASPTYWAGVRIPTPSSVVFDVAPFLRVYARFAVAVTAVLICVAAIGLAAAIRGRRPAVAAAMVAAAIAASVLELPPGGGVPVPSDPPVTLDGRAPEDVPMWAWLRDEAPEDAIVWNFPAVPNEGIERFHMYGQLVHGRTIANGDPQLVGIGTDMTFTDPDPSTPGAAERLSTLGVDLVTIDPALYALAGLPAPDPDRPPAGFAAEQVFPDGSAVWRVTAPPADAISIFHRTTWWPPERIGSREWRFMRDTAEMTVWARRAGTYDVRFGVAPAPPGTHHVLEIEGPGDATRSIPVDRRTTASFPVALPAGRSDFRLTNTGDPAVPLRPGDPRVVSIRMSEWTITPAGDAR